MRRRTFILLILVLLALVAVFLLYLATRTPGGLSGFFGGGSQTTTTEDGDIVLDNTATEPGDTAVAATATPKPEFRDVVVSRVRLPVGTTLTSELLTVEQRPVTNIALQGGYTFTDTTSLVGQITRVEVARGQELLTPMLAVNPTDTASFGSDLALHIPSGHVAVAFNIDDMSGVARAMRPGDLVDFIMTLRTIEIDQEFRSPLPNRIRFINETALLAGQSFLFDSLTWGRLEFVPEINQVAVIVPQNSRGFEQEASLPIPKRVTQLSIQQAEVLWVGVWQDPRELERQEEQAQAIAEATRQADPGVVIPTPTPLPSRLEDEPNIVILSMTAQDALALKWAREEGVSITLALRATGDNTVFATTSVSLPQIIDQGALSIPEPTNFDLVP